MNVPECKVYIDLFRMRGILFEKVLPGFFYDAIFKCFIVKFMRILGG